jgi:hypothetical protein
MAHIYPNNIQRLLNILVCFWKPIVVLSIIAIIFACAEFVSSRKAQAAKVAQAEAATKAVQDEADAKTVQDKKDAKAAQDAIIAKAAQDAKDEQERQNRRMQEIQEKALAKERQAAAAAQADREKLLREAKEQQEFILRYIVPGQLKNSPQENDVVVLVSSETLQPNSVMAQALVTVLRSRSAKASASLFTPAFISDGLFEKAFAGSQGLLDRLALTNVADIVLLARESVEYEKKQSLQGMVTARLKLELSALSAATLLQSQAQTLNSTGAGFREAEARALAEERLLKQIGSKEMDPFFKAVLNNPQ